MALEVWVRAAAPIPLDLGFRVERGEMLAVVGPSGAGKSTLLRTVAGLWRPTQGRVTVGGAAWLDTDRGLWLPPHRRRVGLLAQSPALFPHMTAARNVAAALGDLPRADRLPEARRLLAMVNLPGLEDRRPAELSGGQAQRVGFARALARRPDVLLLDEPFSAVDRAVRLRLHTELRALRDRLDMPVLLVTHDIDEAERLADRLIVLDAGRLRAEGPVAAVLSDPAALHLLGLRQAGAALTARIAAHEADGLTRLDSAAGPLWLPRIDGAPGRSVRVRVLAHEVMIALTRPEGVSALNVLPAEVAAVRPGEGPGAFVDLRLAGGEALVARITRRSIAALGLVPGTACFAVIKSLAAAPDQVIAGPE